MWWEETEFARSITIIVCMDNEQNTVRFKPGRSLDNLCMHSFIDPQTGQFES